MPETQHLSGFEAFFGIIEVSKLGMGIAFMMTSNTERKREQMQIVSMDDLVPQDHMLRLINALLGDLAVTENPVAEIPDIEPVTIDEQEPSREDIEKMTPVNKAEDILPPVSWDKYDSKKPHLFLKELNDKCIQAGKDKELRSRLCAEIKDWAKKNVSMPDKGLRACITNGCDTLFYKAMEQYLSQKGIADGLKPGTEEYRKAVKEALKSSADEDLRTVYDYSIKQTN